jgi:hypothetical protein
MATWIARLDGDPSDLAALVDLGVGVTEESDGVVFRSADLDALTDARAVRERAAEAVAVFSGLRRIAEGDGHARVVSVGAIFCEDGTRQDTFVMPDPCEIRLRGRAARLIGPGDPAAPAANGYAAALRDPAVRPALQYFSAEPTAESLWKVYEVIRDDVGGGDKGRGKALIESQGWATPAELDGFRSVHYPSVLGDEARHGIEPTHQAAPTAPMSLAEARQFVRRLLKHWLASK